MRKAKNKSTYSKLERRYKRRLESSVFLLVFVTGFFLFALLYNAIPLIIILIFFLVGVISEVKIAYNRLKRFRNSPDLQEKFQKKTLKFEKNLGIHVNKLLDKIKVVKEKLSTLEDMYSLFEKEEFLKPEFEDQKEKQQYQNYRLKLDNLKDFLNGIVKNYDEIIKSELKILWITKPRSLKRKITHLSERVNSLSTQCEEIEVKLKEKI